MKKSLISALLLLLPFMSIAEIPDWVKNPPKGEYIGISFIDDDHFLFNNESALFSAITAYMLDQPHNDVDSTKLNYIGYETQYFDSISFDITRKDTLPSGEIVIAIKKGTQNTLNILLNTANDWVSIFYDYPNKKSIHFFLESSQNVIEIEKQAVSNDTIYSVFKSYQIINKKIKPTYITHQITHSDSIIEWHTHNYLDTTSSGLYTQSINRQIMNHTFDLQDILNFINPISKILESNYEKDNNGIKEEKDKINKLRKGFKEEMLRTLRVLSTYAELEFDGYKSGDNVLMFNYPGIFKKTNSLGLSYLYTLCHIQCCKDWFTYQKIDKKPVYLDKEYCLPPLTVNQISIIGDELYIFIDRPEELIIPINNNR